MAALAILTWLLSAAVPPANIGSALLAMGTFGSGLTLLTLAWRQRRRH